MLCFRAEGDGEKEIPTRKGVMKSPFIVGKEGRRAELCIALADMNQGGVRTVILLDSGMRSWYEEKANGDVCVYNKRDVIFFIFLFFRCGKNFQS